MANATTEPTLPVNTELLTQTPVNIPSVAKGLNPAIYVCNTVYAYMQLIYTHIYLHILQLSHSYTTSFRFRSFLHYQGKVVRLVPSVDGPDIRLSGRSEVKIEFRYQLMSCIQ